MARNRNGRTFKEVIEGAAEDLTFGDITFVDRFAHMRDASLQTQLTPKIRLNLPLISSPMEDVTEKAMATAMALHGGLGFIHFNLNPHDAAGQVEEVKRYRRGFIFNPVCRRPDQLVREVHAIKEKHKFSTVLITRDGTPLTELLGMVTWSDILLESPDRPLEYVMTRAEDLRTWMFDDKPPTLDDMRRFFRENKQVQKVPVIDRKRPGVYALVTKRDLVRDAEFPRALTGANEELLVGGAVSTKERDIERSELLVRAGADVLVVDCAQGANIYAVKRIQEIRAAFPDTEIIAGNVSSPDQAIKLIEAGASAIRVGAGPGSICKTSVTHRTGRGQISATWDTIRGIEEALPAHPVPIITDGGIGGMGDAALSFACGASTVMLGRLLAGTDEASSPFLEGGKFKRYRGMGSRESMREGAANRYGADGESFDDEPEEGEVTKVPAIGSVHKLLRMFRKSMIKNLRDHLDCTSIADLQAQVLAGNVRCVRHSPASARERAPHDVTLI